jgi:hypothetical protein
MPGIHVFLAESTRRRGWPGQALDKPGHDEHFVLIRTAFLFGDPACGHRSFTIPH